MKTVRLTPSRLAFRKCRSLLGKDKKCAGASYEVRFEENFFVNAQGPERNGIVLHDGRASVTFPESELDWLLDALRSIDDVRDG